MKCKICNNKVEMLFLRKIIGSYFKDNNGKKQIVCSGCQSRFKTKEEIMKKF